MKACLMKVNYDPKYTTPHLSSSASLQRTSTSHRLSTTNQLFNSSSASITSAEKKEQELAHLRAKERLREATEELKSSNSGAAGLQTPIKLPPAVPTSRILSRATNRSNETNQYASSKVGFNAIETSDSSQIQLAKLAVADNGTTVPKPSSCKHPPVLSSTLQESQRIQLPDAVQKSAPLSKPVHSLYVRTNTFMKSQGHNSVNGSVLMSCQRSKTFLPSDIYNMRSPVQLEVERQAKLEAENAIKNGKVFTVLGPYPSLRAALRKRGWVEKFQNSSADGSVSLPRSVLAEIPANSNQEYRSIVRRKGEGTALAMMSYYVRNCTPTLVFSVKAVDVVSRPTKNYQLVNHFGRASTFTTKAGLCQSLRSVPWFENVDANTFYPRSFNFGEEEEQEAFVDEYRLTACVSFLKHFVFKCKMVTSDGQFKSPEKVGVSVTSSDSTADQSSKDTEAEAQQENTADSSLLDSELPDIVKPVTSNKEEKTELPAIGVEEKNSCVKPICSKSLKFAIKQCMKFLAANEHDDIDVNDNKDKIPEADWNDFLDTYHRFTSGAAELEENLCSLLKSCEGILDSLQQNCPQFQIDGIRNVWILKPGAKSRGRGIQCMNQLSEILDAVAASDCALVAQKYIERPFLVYKTKFDIRQWFLVTDWNPLTMWFYKDCYLRFCSQEFSLDDFHVAIHLSNNSVQKHFMPDPRRSTDLPDDNMWTSDEFIEFLGKEGYHNVWKESVIPGMKKAILCSLLCAQDQVEPRKGSFELFGADFMLDEDLQPWLIEINSSPSMARNTRATAKLVDCVLEDTVKVVLDRKADKSCETGGFELAYRAQTISDPPHTDPDLSVEGKRIKHRYSRKFP